MAFKAIIHTRAEEQMDSVMNEISLFRARQVSKKLRSLKVTMILNTYDPNNIELKYEE